MEKSHNIVNKCHKNVNLIDKKSQTSVKKSQKCNVGVGNKNSLHSVKKTQKCKFKWQKVTTYQKKKKKVQKSKSMSMSKSHQLV